MGAVHDPVASRAWFATGTLVGFVTVGPWLCLFAGRGMALVSRRVPGLLASRRLASDPRATFRAVSGVVLAAFAVTYSGSTVGMLAGLVERRRPFALLRASGLRLGELRRVVFLETAAAMLLTAAVGVGLGLASSYALAMARDMAWSWPDAGVFAMVGAGVLAALLLTTLARPLLDRATRVDTVRYE